MKFRRFRRPLFVETSSTPFLKALQTMVGILRGILRVTWALLKKPTSVIRVVVKLHEKLFQDEKSYKSFEKCCRMR